MIRPVDRPVLTTTTVCASSDYRRCQVATNGSSAPSHRIVTVTIRCDGAGPEVDPRRRPEKGRPGYVDTEHSIDSRRAAACWATPRMTAGGHSRKRIADGQATRTYPEGVSAREMTCRPSTRPPSCGHILPIINIMSSKRDVSISDAAPRRFRPIAGNNELTRADRCRSHPISPQGHPDARPRRNCA